MHINLLIKPQKHNKITIQIFNLVQLKYLLRIHLVLQINPEQIEERLKLFQDKKKIEEYLISEIVINKVPDDEIELFG